MTHEEYFKNKKNLDKKFNEHLIERFGTKEWYEIITIFKHQWLSEYMDYKGAKILRIGTLTDKLNIEQIENEVRAFTEFYAKNPDKVDFDSI